MVTDLLADIKENLINGDQERTVELTKIALENGIEPMTIVNSALAVGMQIVGDRYSTGEFFLPNLVAAGVTMQNALSILEPELQARHEEVQRVGKVVIGTVKGDIHEIGKSLVATMLSCNGFEVYDVGVDVPTEIFIAKVAETEADLLGLSALLTTTMTMQRQIIEELEKADLRDRVKVMVGGAPVSGEWAESIGADGYAEDAMAAVRLAKLLMQ
ncbi:MAG TPA: cobalamin-binding protein [Anaerolineae bacterium]|nr:cobalamin-binding protein [Anaerolineae bacterium]